MLAELQNYGTQQTQLARGGKFGELICGDAVGKYFELAKSGNLYCASMQAGASLGIQLTNVAVTYTLYNPQNSGVYLSLLQCAIVYSALQTTTATIETIVYGGTFDASLAAPSATTGLATRSAIFGTSKVGKGLVYTAATLPVTPIAVRVFPLSAYCTATTQLAESYLAATDNVDGAIVLAPNTSVTIQGIATTTAANGIISMLWAEVPI